jgi:hypothetical protein
MPTIPLANLPDLDRRAYGIVARTSSSLQFTSTPANAQGVLADALLSFSPLATLVGAESARALANSVTNVGQTLVASIAPVGALGMMDTVAKGSNLTGVKEMLCADRQDIKDAARDFGCAAIAGGVIPRMDENGGMVSTGAGYDLDQAAYAIVREQWKTGPDHGLDLRTLRRVPATFVAGTMSGYLRWEIDSQEMSIEMIRRVQQALLIPLSPDHRTTDVFDEMNILDGGFGIIELHWPAPSMPLETNPSAIYLYGSLLVASFVSVAFFACSRILDWQSLISSALLVGGQALLVVGHVAAQYSIKTQREILQVRISVKNTRNWAMIDKARFTSAVALRPIHCSRSHNVTLGQYHGFRRKYIKTWHALFILLTLIVGFGAFYVGGKSSDIRTVAIYIVLFILANATKGPVVRYANKPRYIHLNNFRTSNIVSAPGNREIPKPTVPLLELIVSNTTDGRSSDSSVPPPPTDLGEVKSQKFNALDTFPRPFRIYAKFFIRNRYATDTFFFSSTDEWILAAHIIKTAVKSIQFSASDLLAEHDHNTEYILQIPLYQWDETEQFHGLLFLAIDQIKPEHLFWTIGMEVVSCLMGNFGSPTLLCSQDKAATNTNFLAAFVFTCVRMLCSEHVYCGNVPLPCKQRGADSLMRAIDDTINTTKVPSDTMPDLVALLNRAAKAAKRSRGAIVQSSNMPEPVLEKFSKLKSNEARSMLVSWEKIGDCVKLLQRVECYMDLQQPGEPMQLLAELKELSSMLTRLTDHELGALMPLIKSQAAQLSDKLGLIELYGRHIEMPHQTSLLREIQQEALKDDIQMLALINQSDRRHSWYPQEMLRHYERERSATLKKKFRGREQLEREAYCLIVHMEALLREGQHVLFERLQKEYQDSQEKEQLSVSIKPEERQHQLVKEIDRIKHVIMMAQREREGHNDLDRDGNDDDEYLFRLYQLRSHRDFLELELEEVEHSRHNFLAP